MYIFLLKPKQIALKCYITACLPVVKTSPIYFLRETRMLNPSWCFFRQSKHLQFSRSVYEFWSLATAIRETPDTHAVLLSELKKQSEQRFNSVAKQKGILVRRSWVQILMMPQPSLAWSQGSSRPFWSHVYTKVFHTIKALAVVSVEVCGRVLRGFRDLWCTLIKHRKNEIDAP